VPTEQEIEERVRAIMARERYPSSELPSRPMYEIELTHTIDTGHRIVGHQGKCARVHGHTYTITVQLESARLIEPGFVLDFGDIKGVLDMWDHRTLLWTEDELWATLCRAEQMPTLLGFISVPFNPTAENMARHLAEHFAQENVRRATVEVRETAKSLARWTAVAT
jgi:6-pyruvoyltetrahydropterin/6-carboxytetrahydropterin synthase